ncbi:MAG: collagen-like protein [Bacteroidales bacterium]|nr:collagen-like protein [Bacteroidales bacterium]
MSITYNVIQRIVSALPRSARRRAGGTGGGQSGTTGERGADGAAATIEVGTVTTGEPGTEASVENGGTPHAAVLNFVIPRGATGQQGSPGQPGSAGADGAAATITIGTVTTGEPGTNASVSNSGTTSAAVLNFTIPRGQNVSLRVYNNYIQWRVGTSGTWSNLIKVSDLKGATGDRGPAGEDGDTVAMEQDVDGDIYWWYTKTPSQRNLLAEWNFVKGGRIYCGTALTGTSATQNTNLASPPYKVDDWYINTSTWNVYVCTDASTSGTKWSYVGNIKGPQGSPGAAGQPGADGQPGPAGTDGTRGTRWNVGTAIMGTSTTPTAYATGLSDSIVGDMYLNTMFGDYYRCTRGGNAAAALWKYVGSLSGSGAGALNDRAGGTGITLVTNGPAIADIPVGSFDILSVELTDDPANGVLLLDMDFTNVSQTAFVVFDLYVANNSNDSVTLKGCDMEGSTTNPVDLNRAFWYQSGNIQNAVTLAPYDIVQLHFVRLAGDAPYAMYNVTMTELTF